MLINNAGIQQPLDFSATPPAHSDISREINIDLFGPIALIGALLPLLRSNGSPTIVNVTSGLAFCPLAEVPVYCAWKAALHSFTVSLRHQLKGHVWVVEVAPPIVATELDKADRRSTEGGPPVISAEDFALEAANRFLSGEEEIVVGLANGLRKRGEAMFIDISEH